MQSSSSLKAGNCKVQIPHNQIFLPLTAAESKWAGYGQNVPLLSVKQISTFLPSFNFGRRVPAWALAADKDILDIFPQIF